LRRSLLEQFWKIQRDFQNSVFPNFENLTLKEKVSLTKEMILGITSEFDELLEATGTWKTHRIKGDYPKVSGITEELVDISKFLINIALIWNISPQMFIKKWFEKTVVNKYKFLQERRLKEIRDKPVVVFDLDGVLNSYPVEWIEYVNQNLGTEYKTLDSLKTSVLPETYYKLKETFREEGGHLNFKSIPEIMELIELLRLKEIKIVILSSRPVWRYKRYYADTLTWLKKNKISFDAILWDREKGLRTFKEFSHVICFIEDELNFANEASRYGFKVLLLDKDYNQGKTEVNVKRIELSNLKEEILNCL